MHVPEYVRDRADVLTRLGHHRRDCFADIGGIAATFGELADNPKRGFKTLVCTTEAADWSTKAAERRAETAKSLENIDANGYDLVTEDENGLSIKLGKRNWQPGVGIAQSLAITNNGSGRHQFAMFDCGFYFKGELVGTGGGIIANLYPGKTKFGSAMGLQIDKADGASCNVSHTP